MTVVLFACMAIMVAVLCLHVLLVLLKKGERTFYFDAAADIVPSKKRIRCNRNSKSLSEVCCYFFKD